MTAGEAGDFKCLRDPPQAPCLRRPELFPFDPALPSLFEEYPFCPDEGFPTAWGRRVGTIANGWQARRGSRQEETSRPDTEDRSSFCLRWRMAIAIAGKACDLRGQALAGLADFRSWRDKLESRTQGPLAVWT